jgi:hypothetical protein
MADEAKPHTSARGGIAKNATQIVSGLTTKYNDTARAFRDANGDPFLAAQKREDDKKKDKQ